jgi:hypothetical protein
MTFAMIALFEEDSGFAFPSGIGPFILVFILSASFTFGCFRFVLMIYKMR